MNELILVGNGFDLAHGLKTSYRDFLDWYFCRAFKEFYTNKKYQDELIEIKNLNLGTSFVFENLPSTYLEVLKTISSTRNQKIQYHSNFLNRIISDFQLNNWVDIEILYYSLLKIYFKNPNINNIETIRKLNRQFDYFIIVFIEYISFVNKSLVNTPGLKIIKGVHNLYNIFFDEQSQPTFLNFNYTDTLTTKGYANDDNIIYIHGKSSEIEKNPIIFGYGDESDPSYQAIEDSGINLYLDHIKSFGYFNSNNYNKLITYIDSKFYHVNILGHSCGLSDRVLLSEIFEHPNCKKINIFYHRREDGSDNFKEITQQISRHFKPSNKNIMRRKIEDKNLKNLIPQNYNFD